MVLQIPFNEIEDEEEDSLPLLSVYLTAIRFPSSRNMREGRSHDSIIYASHLNFLYSTAYENKKQTSSCQKI